MVNTKFSKPSQRDIYWLLNSFDELDSVEIYDIFDMDPSVCTINDLVRTIRDLKGLNMSHIDNKETFIQFITKFNPNYQPRKRLSNLENNNSNNINNEENGTDKSSCNGPLLMINYKKPILNVYNNDAKMCKDFESKSNTIKKQTSNFKQQQSNFLENVNTDCYEKLKDSHPIVNWFPYFIVIGVCIFILRLYFEQEDQSEIKEWGFWN